MTGFAYPEMLVSVSALFAVGRSDEAEDLFDAYLPLVRHEQQPGFGLAVRKEILRRRGAIRSPAVCSPSPKLEALDIAELDRLLSRLETRLKESAHGGPSHRTDRQQLTSCVTGSLQRTDRGYIRIKLISTGRPVLWPNTIWSYATAR